jgi:hypothetical protein
MATDRITEVVVKFENADGSEVLHRTYKMLSETTWITANDPQGMVPGYLRLKGAILAQSDKGEQG